MILIVDNVLSEEECQNIICSYAQYQNNAEFYFGTKPLDLKFITDTPTQKSVLKIKNSVSQVFKDIECDWGQVVKWHPSNYHPLHLDEAKKRTVLTSITYLNEDFIGGETYFEDGTLIKPVKGRTLIFDGTQYVHGVVEILSGIRWTLPIWYKKQGG